VKAPPDLFTAILAAAPRWRVSVVAEKDNHLTDMYRAEGVLHEMYGKRFAEIRVHGGRHPSLREALEGLVDALPSVPDLNDRERASIAALRETIREATPAPRKAARRAS
jgi:hypothetical protein